MGYDAYFHTNMANLISTTGIVPPFEISGKYVNYPILHIFIAITKIISFITIKDAVFFSIGIISIICTLFLFIFVNRYAGPRVGLLSTLIFCITTQIIVTGITNITAGSLVLCYFLMLMCLLIDRERHPHTLLLCLIIMFTIVITHQLSSFVVFISLCLFTFSLLLYEHVL
jgi:4-amino-4-deoxy-L-arabinose transferase-like glycosyltransferase